MKDYQRPVLTLKCSGTGATVLSSVSKHAGHTKSLNSLTVTLPGSPQLPKTFFLNLRQEVNLLTLVEDLDILGYLYFFIENFNNSILLK